MRSAHWKSIWFAFGLVSLLFCGQARAQAPAISNISPSSGPVGSAVVITGSGFGSTQGTSMVSFNGTNASVTNWSATSVVAIVPSGATSGVISITVGTQTANSTTFTVSSLPSGWTDADVGSVGFAGSGSYASGTYTVKGSGQWIYSTADGMNFTYLPMSGDGAIVARLVSVSGSTNPYAGVMIRESLAAGSTHAFAGFQGPSYSYFADRATTGGSAGYQSGPSVTLPYWFKLVRSGSSFSAYISLDGVNWTAQGSTQTVGMAESVYAGLAVSASDNTALATATFDNVSINTLSAPAPVVASLSATTGPGGTQVVISGADFGATQGSSEVMLSGVPISASSWSGTSITVTIPTGATSGPLMVALAPTLVVSNAAYFTVTSQPLPATWLDQDVGQIGVVGSATYGNGTFTVKGSGQQIYGTADSMHFVYQPLSGDGTIIARIVSSSGSTNAFAGVMIRETFDTASDHAFAGFQVSSYNYFEDRATAGGSTTYQSGSGATLPYWVKLVRSGSTFTGYGSQDGNIWTQIGTSQTISMAQNVFIGLAVSGGATSTLATFTFDNVSISTPTAPAPVISGVSATTGSVGGQIVISGSAFGSSQGSSVVTLNGTSLTVNSWSGTSITATIPTGATSGPLLVSVAPSMNDSNAIYFTVTANPLPAGWLDQDVGSVGVTGSGTYSSGTYTVKGAGQWIYSTSDGMHFVYSPLSGDGTLVARIASASGSSYMMIGAMMRETLSPSSSNIFAAYEPAYMYMTARTSTGASSGYSGGPSVTLPYWVRLTRSGNSFSAYSSSDGASWSQIGSSQTISMAQNIYVGLAVSNQDTTSLATVTFDNVSVTGGTPNPVPVITSVSPGGGGAGASVTITGVNFGSTQGSSTINFNGTAATSVTSWSGTQIVATVPSSATSGPVTVYANSIRSNANFTFTVYHPVITSLTPPAAPPGGFVTLTGTGFSSGYPDGTVRFNGINASCGNWTDTSAKCIVPSSATSGSVTLTLGGVASSGISFTVLSPLTVTSISPTSGPIGQSITINGTGFGSTQSTSTAAVNGVALTVTSWSDTQIVATVASGTDTGAVLVEVAGIVAEGPTFRVDNTLTLTDSLGNTTSYTTVMIGGMWYVSDAQGSGCSSCTQRGNIHYTFDSRGNVLSATDALSHTTTYTYDTSNNLLTQTVPITATNSATTTYTYNSFGKVLTVTDPLGNVTTNTYDAKGNLLTVTTPAPDSSTAASVTTFAYDTKGELTSITDPLSHVTTIAYNSVGLISTITDAQSHVTTYAYDARGNRTSVTDALSHQTTFAYDAMNRLTTITYPDTTTTTFTYDIRGRRTSVTDQNGKTTSYAYDDADRLLTVTDAASHVTTYAYDTESNLTSIEDASSNTTAFTYDAYGRVTQTNFPSTHVETYAYDANNNLTSKTDRKNQTITYAYDELNRLTEKTYPDSTTVNYTYDNDSRLTQVTDPTGTYAFTFDNMGRLTGTTTSYSFLTSRTFTTGYSYDKASNRTGFTDPESGSTSYAYDALNRLSTLTPPSAFVSSGNFGFSYDALSRRTQMTRPNSITTNYSYDNLSRLTSVLHQLSSSTIDGATYTLDNAGNRTVRTPQPSGTASNYAYDNIYELTGVTQGTTTTESYTYDAVGNRTASLGVSSYTTNASNELTATSTASYTYDYNGNTTSKTVGTNTTSYSWDYENRLTSVTLPGTSGTVSFAYDPFGRRIKKVTSSTSTTSIFAYDEGNLIEETNSSGTAVARYAQTDVPPVSAHKIIRGLLSLS